MDNPIALSQKTYDRFDRAASKIEQTTRLQNRALFQSPVVQYLKVTSGSTNSNGYRAYVQVTTDGGITWTDQSATAVRVRNADDSALTEGDYVHARFAGMNSGGEACFLLVGFGEGVVEIDYVSKICFTSSYGTLTGATIEHKRVQFLGVPLSVDTYCSTTDLDCCDPYVDSCVTCDCYDDVPDVLCMTVYCQSGTGNITCWDSSFELTKDVSDGWWKGTMTGCTDHLGTAASITWAFGCWEISGVCYWYLGQIDSEGAVLFNQVPVDSIVYPESCGASMTWTATSNTHASAGPTICSTGFAITITTDGDCSGSGSGDDCCGIGGNRTIVVDGTGDFSDLSDIYNFIYDPTAIDTIFAGIPSYDGRFQWYAEMHDPSSGSPTPYVFFGCLGGVYYFGFATTTANPYMGADCFASMTALGTWYSQAADSSSCDEDPLATLSLTGDGSSGCSGTLVLTT